MKLLIYLSLVFLSPCLWSSANEDIGIIEEYELSKIDVRSKMEKSWDKLPELEQESFRYKGQTRNLIEWDRLEPRAWFSFKEWMKERKLRDQDKLWRQKLRDRNHTEVVGRVLKCLGSCVKFDELNRVNAEFRTILNEGDEFVTANNSAAWLVLMDGSLLRVSANTSLTMNELNVAKKKFFISVRLNQGHFYYIHRRQGEFVIKDQPQTDLGFYPLLLLEANREYHSMLEYRQMSEVERLQSSTDANLGYQKQGEELNKYLAKNTDVLKEMDTYFYFYTPSYSLTGKNKSFEMFYEPDSDGHFYINGKVDNFTSSDQRGAEIKLLYRGYNNLSSFAPEDNTLYEVDPLGQTAVESEKNQNHFLASRTQIKRATSIYLAREIWLKKYSIDMISAMNNPYTLARTYGYRLWNEENTNEIEHRVKFMEEYVRRVETSNLASLKKLTNGIPKKGFDKSFFFATMNVYYDAIKNRHSESRLKVRELSNTEFYLWALRNGNE